MDYCQLCTLSGCVGGPLVLGHARDISLTRNMEVNKVLFDFGLATVSAVDQENNYCNKFEKEFW